MTEVEGTQVAVEDTLETEVVSEKHVKYDLRVDSLVVVTFTCLSLSPSDGGSFAFF